MRHIAVKIISLYQRSLSPDEGWFKWRYPGGYCKFTPHCSEYGKQAFLKHGFIHGTVLTLWRIIRCNPWSVGGDDPVR